MILEIDVGNSFLKWRLFDEADSVVRRGRLSSRGSLDALVEQWPRDLRLARVASVAGADVNEALDGLLQALACRDVRFAQSQAQAAGVTNSYADPSAMGVDRWLAMLAAWRSCTGACCVVDCGSAITVDFLDSRGVHQGGYILPGMRLLQNALLANTARVFSEDGEQAFDTTPGTDTISAVRRGADFLFDAVRLRLQDQLESHAPQSRLFVTGGDGELFQRLMGAGDWVPDLVLDGLELALDEG